jgi:hypothetical protein
MYVLQILLTRTAARKIRATPYSIRVTAQANQVHPKKGFQKLEVEKSRVKNGAAFFLLGRYY